MSEPVRRRLAVASRIVDGVTGTTTTILEHTRRLAALGWEVHVFGEAVDEKRIVQAGGVARRVVGFPWGSYVKRRLFSWQFSRAMRGQSYDIVWGHGDTLEQDVLSLHNCVHLAHEEIRGEPLPEGSGVGKLHAEILSGRKFKILIANSELMKADAVSRFGIPPESVRVIHPGFNPSRFRPQDWPLGAPLRRELGLAEGEILLGLVTSGDFVKRGVGLLLRAVGGLRPELRDKLHVLIVGREKDLEPYRRLAGEAGLGERARFLAPRPEVERIYHALDLMVHPALFEEFGQSVQEAMACGVPVVTSERVGAAELLARDCEARRRLMPRSTEEGVRAALENALGDPALRRRLAEDGIQACRDNSWDRNFRLTSEIYQSLLVTGSDREAV